jgi:predicted DNA-binding transcriptional regulator AlpA
MCDFKENPLLAIYSEIREAKELMQQSNNSNTVTVMPDRWLTMEEFQDYHPAKPKAPTVYEWCAKRKVPFYKQGRANFFLKSEIDEWLKKGRVKTTSEISEQANAYLKKRA